MLCFNGIPFQFRCLVDSHRLRELLQSLQRPYSHHLPLCHPAYFSTSASMNENLTRLQPKPNEMRANNNLSEKVPCRPRHITSTLTCKWSTFAGEVYGRYHFYLPTIYHQANDGSKASPFVKHLYCAHTLRRRDVFFPFISHDLYSAINNLHDARVCVCVCE